MIQLETLKEKPRFGDPCNRCGRCCAEVPCLLGEVVFNQVDGQCPALEFDGLEASCGLLANTRKYVTANVGDEEIPQLQRFARQLIGKGDGCCSVNGAEIAPPRLVKRRLRVNSLLERNPCVAVRRFIAWKAATDIWPQEQEEQDAG